MPRYKLEVEIEADDNIAVSNDELASGIAAAFHESAEVYIDEIKLVQLDAK